MAPIPTLALLPQLAILSFDIPRLLVALPYLCVAPPLNSAELSELDDGAGNEIDTVGRVERRQRGGCRYFCGDGMVAAASHHRRRRGIVHLIHLAAPPKR